MKIKDYLDKEIQEKKEELRLMGIRHDRDLLDMMRLDEQQKDMFFKWLNYQGLYEKRAGVVEGQEELAVELRSALAAYDRHYDDKDEPRYPNGRR